MKYVITVLGSILLSLPPATVPAAVHNPDEEAVQETAREIYGLIMCPLCAGQTIAQSSNETSRQMRNLVLTKLRQGETKEEILRYFKSRYGERILAKPDKQGFNLILWLLPFTLVVLAAVAVYFLIRRWSSKRHATSDPYIDEDKDLEYEKRLEAELEQFGEGLRD